MASLMNADAEASTRRQNHLACDTCRARKSKCSGALPKCSLCQRLGIDCVYREPLPTKKDKTMVHILDSLARIENKFDSLALSTSLIGHSIAPTSNNASQEPTKQGDGASLTNAQRIIFWPSIYIHLVETQPSATLNLQQIFHRGSSWFIEQEALRHASTLAPYVGLATESLARDGHPPIITFPWLTIDKIQQYSEAYFHTFNVFNPLLDQAQFTDEVITPLLTEGYAYGDTKGIIALLVYALGQLALEGTLGTPISVNSGVRGGSSDRSPGIEIFHEARKRLSVVSSHGTLESVIIHLLTALYYQANALHLDFWKATWCASVACQAYIRCSPHDLQSAEMEPLRQVFWMCQLNENICRFDLDMPVLALQDYREVIPAPSRNFIKDDRPHHHYFPAFVQLDRLITEIYTLILEPSVVQSNKASGYTGPSMPVVREMARKLESWRALLPRTLQWADSEMHDFPRIDVENRLSEKLFSPDQGPVAIRHLYSMDVMVAYLRTRYYYARHLVYQPFIYKVLHFSERLTTEDVDCAAIAIRSACLWPLLMAPPKDKKRLIPQISSWSQVFISILLIFQMTRKHDTLRNICETHVAAGDVQQTVSLMMNWLRDIKQIDGIAEQGWEFLETLFSK